MTTVWSKLCEMNEKDVLVLLLEAEELDRTGVLPPDASLRKLTEEIFGDSMVLHMMSVSYNVYKMFAVTYCTHSPFYDETVQQEQKNEVQR